MLISLDNFVEFVALIPVAVCTDDREPIQLQRCATFVAARAQWTAPQ
jgi:hypothetical protein